MTYNERTDFVVINEVKSLHQNRVDEHASATSLQRFVENFNVMSMFFAT